MTIKLVNLGNLYLATNFDSVSAFLVTELDLVSEVQLSEIMKLMGESYKSNFTWTYGFGGLIKQAKSDNISLNFWNKVASFSVSSATVSLSVFSEDWSSPGSSV